MFFRKQPAKSEPVAVEAKPTQHVGPARRSDTPLSQRLVFEAIELAVEYVYCSAVPGNFAEFGTMSGASASAIAYGMLDQDQRYRNSDRMHNIGPRSLYLFDSFEGLPKAQNQIDLDSPHIANDVWGAGVAKGLTAQQLHALCGDIIGNDRVVVTPGWYSQSLKSFPTDLQFALVSIDCDLYESTTDVLDYLLGNKTYSDGCTVLFDDWYCNRGSPEFGEQKAWADATKRYGTKFTDVGSYAMVGRRFILHR